MPQIDRVGTAATGFGVVGIGILAMANGSGLAPKPAHMAAAKDRGFSAPSFIGSPEDPVARHIVSGPLAAPLQGTQAGAIWFKGFRLDRVNEPFGLLRSLAHHEKVGRIQCRPSLLDLDATAMVKVQAVSCAGEDVRLRASLSRAKMTALALRDRDGGELSVVGDVAAMPGARIVSAAD